MFALLAQVAGGIGVKLDGGADLINCTIYSNTAAGLDNSTAALNVESGRLWLGNGTRFANNSFRVEAAEVIYVLPAPPGHYTNGRECEVVYTSCPPPSEGHCPNGCTQDKSLIPGDISSNCTQRPYYIQSCPWNMYLVNNAFGEKILGLLLEKLLPGVYDRPEWPVPCSPGLLGATTDSTNGQVSPFCAGLCPAGFYCPAYATTEPIPCTPGHYCPEGASAPLPCKEGSYSTATNLTSAVECTPTEPGFYAPTSSTAQTPCSPGTFAPNASMGACNVCPDGSFANETGTVTCKLCASCGQNMWQAVTCNRVLGAVCQPCSNIQCGINQW